MMSTSCEAALRNSYQLRFDSLLDARQSPAFPCDAAGTVDLDELTERERNDYFFARTCIGREFGRPSIHRLIGEAALG
jgi:hypothetical protein